MRTAIRIILILALAYLLTSCCSMLKIGCKEPDCVVAPKDFPLIVLPEQEPLDVQAPKWIVVTPENSKEVFEQLQKANIDAVIFGLTDEGYETLSISTEKVQGYMLLQRDREAQKDAYYKALQKKMTEKQ